MPKKTINYNNTIIYKIVCNDINIKELYVGSTTDFRRRKSQHKTACNYIINKLKVYEMIRQNEGWNNWQMVEIEKYPCNDGNEARARERYWFDHLNASMNMIKPYVTRDEVNENRRVINQMNNI